MTSKAEFNAAEWSLILEGPAIAGLIAISAERGGTLRETIQMAKVYAEAARSHEGPELLHEIVSSAPEIDRERYHSAEDLRAQGLRRLLSAVRLLERKADPEELEGYKRFVMKVAETAARAHKEGGFLGIGGKEISEAEQAALDEIARALEGDGKFLFGKEHVDRYRATGGKEGHDWRGTHTLLLTTTGKSSGDERTTPLIYGQDNGNYLVVASKGGADEPPAWLGNLQENPEVEVQVKDDRFKAHAREATPDEKPRLWRTMTAQWPDYDGYQQKTDREIPVVVLERA